MSCNTKLKAIRRLSLIVNLRKKSAKPAAAKFASYAEANGMVVNFAENFPLEEYNLAQSDAIVSFGGDGTFLTAAKYALKYNLPILGVNCGNVGFLATFSLEGLISQLVDLKTGNYRVKNPTLLNCELSNSNKNFHALNDIVIKAKRENHLLSLSLKTANDVVIEEVRCDGLIFSTPTGSTAYNLSANGPIICPKSKVFATTAVCPHNFLNRSIIFSEDTVLQLDASCELYREYDLFVDGELIETESIFPIKIFCNAQKLSIISTKDDNYFMTIRKKLNWQSE